MSFPSPFVRPGRVTLPGQYVTVMPLDTHLHSDALWEGSGGVEHAALWAYMPEGPYLDRAEFDAALARQVVSEDPLFFAIVDNRTARAVGRAAYLRIEPAHGVIEVGGILYTPSLRRTRGATEAMYLMARYILEDLDYRRYEWKCDALNGRSRAAALRLGFTFEGVFRQHMIVKGHNRDTAWFSMLDSEWPHRKKALQRWLDPSNFDEHERQRQPLSFFMADQLEGGVFKTISRSESAGKEGKSV